MLIGPAIGIEKINPARKPAIDMVIILSITKILPSMAKKSENLYEIKDFTPDFYKLDIFHLNIQHLYSKKQ
jgi:hypothetical protein